MPSPSPSRAARVSCPLRPAYQSGTVVARTVLQPGVGLEEEEDDGLSVWGSKKKESKPKPKPEPKAAEPAKKAEKLSIW